MSVSGLQARQFERLLQLHWQSLRRLAIRLTGNPEDAEDLLQDLVERVTPRMGEVIGLDAPRPWLARVLYRLFVDRWRRGEAAPNTDTEADVEAQPDHRDLPEAAFDRALTLDRLQAALDRLSPALREAVILHDVEGYKLTEIGTIVGVPTGTLKSRLHRGRARLRELLVDGTFSDSGS